MGNWVFDKQKFAEWLNKQTNKDSYKNYQNDVDRLENKTVDECFKMGYIIDKEWLRFK